MPRNPTNPREIQVVPEADGTVSLHGLSGQDLRNLLTLTSLQSYESLDKARTRVLDGNMDDVVHANNVDDARTRLWQRMLIDVLSIHASEAIHPGSTAGAPAAERAVVGYERALKTLDSDVREAEVKAAAIQACMPEVPDPLAGIAHDLKAALRVASSAVANLEGTRRNMRVQSENLAHAQARAQVEVVGHDSVTPTTGPK